ncbi:DUF2147 domain-containing protein [Neisseria shayeganii]|uniref:DUF2147 domain-containing protein n=1 Tax=Neisseria shayeganii TaxID=607712 RepID=A0A7D7RNR2_9NEIS|nr:DUF2147 domain-containing protein [Neisseria shayeganii]QMT41222.1 DUF2147 domain-containing protein [Neisseria shayeganii]
MRNPKQWLLAAALTCLTAVAGAEGIVGQWRTVDDETGKPKAVIRISENNGVYNGTIVQLMPGIENRCPGCSGDKANAPLVGMTVLTGLKEEDGKYVGGRIFDPKSGNTYRAKAELADGGNALKVRGYMGVSALGRTQTWQRVR